MHLTWTNFGEALLWSAAAAAATWLLLSPLRRHSVRGLLTALVLTGAAASSGALLGAAHAMLIPELHWPTVLALIGLAAAAAGAAAYAAGRRLAGDHARLRSAVAELAGGGIPVADPRRTPAEVARVQQELRATAASLAAARQRERALEAARRELVAWISHDLRTPLAGLRAMAEALEDGLVEQPEQYYKQIVASVDRLNRMVEDLFDLSRIQAGASTAPHEDVALTEVVAECLIGLEPLAAAEHVQLTGLTDSSALGVTVRGDRDELTRALTNVVANAIRHTAAGGTLEVRLDVSGGLGDPGEPMVAELTIRDGCGGIPDDQIDRVFDVGFRGELARSPATGRHPAGAGLGLAITRGIVEAHAGSVSVANRDGGCEFAIRLPASASAG